jgi:two-component system sensor kinase FixL
VAWIVNRTVERAQDSNRLVVHTQEVLSTIEAVLSTLAGAESAASTYLASPGIRGPEPLDQAERTRNTDANRLSNVIADNPNHQAPVRQLRQAGVTSALVVLAVGLLGLIGWLVLRAARHQRQDADALRHAKNDLALQVDARAADLSESNERLRSIIDSAVDGIIVIDGKGTIEAFNRGAERLFGYPASEVVGRNVNILMPSPYHEEHDTYLARYLATGVQKIIGTGREVIGLRQDGSTFPLHLSVGEMLVGGARKFTGILHDLSARVRIEEQLREQTSLARLGEMAAVIAHEVKNPLAGVRGAIQVIGSRLPQDGRDAAMIKEIVSRIDTLNALMQDLLLFARPPQPKPAPIDVATLVTTTADLLGSDPALKEVRVTVEGRAPRIMADADLLKIVFVNLLVNSAHAMKGRGTIRVSLAAIANSCQIAFADDGPGIPSEVRERIFTPFFTTKARGSGLGLPTAKRLVEAHRGNISIACPTAGGTIVTVELPQSGAAAAV